MAGDKQPSLMTPVGICSFPNLAKPRQQNAKDKAKKPRYSTIIAWTPELLKRKYPTKDGDTITGKDMLKALMKSALECLEAKYPGKAKSMIESGKLNWPFRSMDDEDPDDTPHAFPEGTIWIQPATTGKPGIVDRFADSNGDPVEIDDDEIEDKVYAGCLVRATVRAYFYDTDGNKGVSFSLNNVQKAGEGERLDGRKKATKEFDALEEGADDFDEDQPRRTKKAAPRRAARDDDEEEEAPRPKRRAAAREEEDDEEDEAPRRRKPKARDPIGDDDDEETTVPRTKKRAAPRDEEEDEDEPVRRRKPSRGRTLDDTL